MKIRMLRTAAGPDGVFNAGKEYDVPAKLGKEFIDGGAAESLATIVETATAAPQYVETTTDAPRDVETATAAPQDVETAAGPKADTTKPKKLGRPKKKGGPKADSRGQCG